MAGLLGVLSVSLAVATNEVVEDFDGGPPGGSCWWVRQRHHFHRKASMVAPWGMLSVGPAAATIVLSLLLELLSLMASLLGAIPVLGMSTS
jgi:uncharacterized BrkB/YihY/UPF0761 family membrane protein